MSFDQIYYKGKTVERDSGFDSQKTQVIIMQKNNPDRLDMRYKVNREWVEYQNTEAVKAGVWLDNFWNKERRDKVFNERINSEQKDWLK